MQLKGPVWLMQPIPYFGEKLEGKWIWEPKIDGWRIQIIKYENDLEVWGRRLEKKPNWTEKLYWLISDLNKILPPKTIVDAELYTSKGRRFIPSLFAREKKVEPIVYVFDVIFYDGVFVAKSILQERKKLLKNIAFFAPFYIMDGETLTDMNDALQTAIKEGHEGIIIKKIDSVYDVGEHAPLATINWRKIKSL
jgi:ATP-dependent DNA ligase